MQRLRFLVWKEFLELRLNPRLFGVVVVAPIIQLTLLGYAATNDAGLLDGEVSPSWVASEAALETVIEAPLQRPSTRGVFATG